MASIILPASPAIQSAKPSMLSFGTLLTPFLGGPTQRINRLGSRWTLTIRMAPMRAEPDGRIWVNALARGLEAGVLTSFPQDIDVGNPGNPLVSVAVTSGTTLPIKGLSPGYSVKAGQFVSIIHSGRRYMYMFTADAVANGSGNLSAAIFPLLRTPLSINDVIEVASPKIEGWLAGQFDWDILRLPMVQLPEFTITEAA